MSKDQPAGPRPAGGDPLARGTTIGRYVVVGLLGRGAMGEVHAAYDPELDRKIAIKLVRAKQQSGVDASEGRTRLLREAQAIAKLSHPNVVVVHDVGTYGDDVFIAMEFVDGQTLTHWLHAAPPDQPRTWRQVLALFTAAGRGLAAAHEAGLIHRDFKPDNVMVAGDGQVRVMDFGLARQMAEKEPPPTRPPSGSRAVSPAASDPDLEETITLGRRTPSELPTRLEVSTSGARLLNSRLTQTGAMMGTPAYMAPEQFTGGSIDARTDQFSFCVALYESLYGQRPFAGTDFTSLMAGVLSGEVAPAPANARVPTWLRRVLLRGLRPSAAARYPSMGALLQALDRDPSRARARVLTATVSALALAMLGAVGWRTTHAPPRLCVGGAAKVAEVWEVAGLGAGPRREAIRRAFSATGQSYADQAFTGMATLLDRYRGAWTAMYSDACEATHVRGEQSAEVLDLRMSCLDERLGRLKALTDVFTAANATTVENAVAAAAALPSLERCADVKLLRAVIPPPEAAETRARVIALQADIARVKALADSGHCATARDAGRVVIEKVRATGYLPLEAQALHTQAHMGSECLDPAEGSDLEKRAALAALTSHDEETATEAMILLGHVQVDRTDNIHEARSWLELGEAILRGMGRPHPELQTWLLMAQARLYAREGDRDKALQTFKEAQVLMEKLHGLLHPDISKVLNNTGVVLEDMHRYEEALGYFRLSYQSGAQVLGPDHPEVGLVMANQAEVLNLLHRWDEARVAGETSLAIWRHAGASMFYAAYSLTGIGESLLGLGRYREAREKLEEAMRLGGAAPSPFRATTEFAMARALWPNPADRQRALKLAREARADWQRPPGDPDRVAAVETWLRSSAAN